MTPPSACTPPRFATGPAPLDPQLRKVIAGLDPAQLWEQARVVALPMKVRFRGVTVREALLIEGPCGWGEFSPFVEYPPQEAAAWLAAGIEAAYVGLPPVPAGCPQVPVNATVPAVAAAQVPQILADFPGCTTVKVKVAEAGLEFAESLAADEARVAAVRQAVPGATIRVDANRGWSVEQALVAAERLGPLEYLEQPCAQVEELAAVGAQLARRGIFTRVAADESIRRADDPFAVAHARAATVAVLKVAPLGGVRRTVAIADYLARRSIDVVIASALDTAVGITGGIAAAALLPRYEDDDAMPVPPRPAGLATGNFFSDDVAPPRRIADGAVSTAPVAIDPAAVARLTAPPQRTRWWRERLYATLAALQEQSAA